MEQEQYQDVVRVQTALSNKPMFIKLNNLDYSVDRIFSEAVSNLKNTGKPLESQQLEQLYKEHQLFVNGKVIQKGDILKDLFSQTSLIQKQEVQGQQVRVLNLDLISSHSGGYDLPNVNLKIENPLAKNLNEILEQTNLFKSIFDCITQPIGEELSKISKKIDELDKTLQKTNKCLDSIHRNM